MTTQNVILPPYEVVECHMNRQCTRQLKIQKDAYTQLHANKFMYLVI